MIFLLNKKVGFNIHLGLFKIITDKNFLFFEKIDKKFNGVEIKVEKILEPLKKQKVFGGYIDKNLHNFIKKKR